MQKELLVHHHQIIHQKIKKFLHLEYNLDKLTLMIFNLISIIKMITLISTNNIIIIINMTITIQIIKITR